MQLPDMRKIISFSTLLLALILVCGCTNSTNVQTTSSDCEPVDTDVQFTWTKSPDAPDVLTVAGTTNIPDGAKLRCSAYEGRYPKESESKYANIPDIDDWIVVKNGKFTYDLVLTDYFEGDFTKNTVLFTIYFTPGATIQPESIVDCYDGGALLEAADGDPSFVVLGPIADIDRKVYYYEVFVTLHGDTLKVEAGNDYFGKIEEGEKRLERAKHLKKK